MPAAGRADDALRSPTPLRRSADELIAPASFGIFLAQVIAPNGESSGAAWMEEKPHRTAALRMLYSSVWHATTPPIPDTHGRLLGKTTAEMGKTWPLMQSTRSPLAQPPPSHRRRDPSALATTTLRPADASRHRRLRVKPHQSTWHRYFSASPRYA